MPGKKKTNAENIPGSEQNTARSCTLSFPHQEHLYVCPVLLIVGTHTWRVWGIMGTGVSTRHIGTLAPAFLSSVLKGPFCYLRAWMFCELLSWDLPICSLELGTGSPRSVTLSETTRQVHSPCSLNGNH